MGIPPLLACHFRGNGFWVEVKEAFLNPGRPRLLCTSGLGAWGCGSAIEHLPRTPSVKQTPAWYLSMDSEQETYRYACDLQTVKCGVRARGGGGGGVSFRLSHLPSALLQPHPIFWQAGGGPSSGSGGHRAVREGQPTGPSTVRCLSVYL